MVAIQVERAPEVALPDRTAIQDATASTGVGAGLDLRRRRVRSVRRQVIGIDALLSGAMADAALVADYRVAALVCLAVGVAVIARVATADGPRAVVSARPVVRATALCVALACVLSVVLDGGADGREVLGGAGSVATAMLAFRCAARLPFVSRRWTLGQRRRLIVGDPQALENTGARRSPAVEAGELILVVTRAERAVDESAEHAEIASVPAAAETPDSASDASDAVALQGGAPDDGAAMHDLDQRRRARDERDGPSGLVERVVRTALENSVERVTVIPGASWQRRQLRELSWMLEGTGIDLVISTDLDGIAPHRADVVRQDGRLVLKIGSASPRGTQMLIKGALDRLGAAILLTVLAPLLAVVAAVIRLDSRGPVIFRQTRVREGGVTFVMWKFRTMHVDAEAQLGGLKSLNEHAEGPLFKIHNDPRITRVGHLLRRTSLDELPQLVNVLGGQMSLIGPRPALPREVAQYDYAARRRLAVKPGLTGLWQVSGRSRLSWDESIGVDLDYVDNWSPVTDAAIAVRTLKAVITQDGAC